jgi:outer membrane immunogenic protein
MQPVRLRWFQVKALSLRAARPVPRALGNNDTRRMGDKMMNAKLLGTGLAAVAVLASSLAAQAADLRRPIYKAPMSEVAYYNWTGFYAGINGGYGWGSSTWGVLPGTRIKPSGGLVGGTVGYNMQVGAIVYGFEGDFDWSGLSGSVACAPGLAICETSSDWLATFRGRIGYSFDRWLPYVTGGGAAGDVKATASAPLLGTAISSSNTQLGWTLGGGVEFAFMSNWTAKVEYLHVDLGSFDTGPAPIANNVNFRQDIVRAGLNYRFTGPAFNRY